MAQFPKKPTGMAKITQQLNERFKAQGWGSYRQFTHASKVPLSMETVRRALNGDDEKCIEPLSLAVICRHLAFNNDEIRDIIREYAQDTDIDDKLRNLADDFWPMLGKADSQRLSVYDKAMLSSCKQIAGDNYKQMAMLANQLDLVARALRVDVTEHTRLLRRKKG